MTHTLTLNEQADLVADELEARADDWRIRVHHPDDARLIDCGAEVVGGLQAGLALARCCLADRGDVQLVPTPIPGLPGPGIAVTTDDPINACLASQYAGWQVQVGKYFAMGSGAMRAAYGKEALFDDIPGREEPPVAVGILETRKVPTEEVLGYLRERLPESVRDLTVAFAPACSIAGTVQVVARSVETALHKLHELKFDLAQVVSGYGVAPMPPIGADDLKAIGWTNDAILYGASVTLWVNAEDDQLAEIGPQVPSTASSDHGAPFAELFARTGDFYKIDPLLFSPAEITFQNVRTGRCHVFGRVEADLLRRSFSLIGSTP